VRGKSDFHKVKIPTDDQTPNKGVVREIGYNSFLSKQNVLYVITSNITAFCMSKSGRKSGREPKKTVLNDNYIRIKKKQKSLEGKEVADTWYSSRRD